MNTEEWIPVSKELPDIGEYVLIYNTEGGTLIGRRFANDWIALFSDGENAMGEFSATHWMPLPQPPIEPDNHRCEDGHYPSIPFTP